jgi:hypothetical protein
VGADEIDASIAIRTNKIAVAVFKVNFLLEAQ